ncbi:MAG: OmpA family protein [Gemmatimonadales bacterium]
MRTRIIKYAIALATVVPALALAQQQPTVDRVQSWEFSVGGGVTVLDQDLLDSLTTGPLNPRFTNGNDPSRIVPTGVVRLGYNFTNNLGFSLGTALAAGSGVKYLTPFGAVTATFNLNAKTSPFLTAGLQGTRISGQNNSRTHPTWGAHLGAGVRSMVSDHLALRLEGRIAREFYQDPDVKAAYLPVVTLGISYFTHGRRTPAASMMAPACNCPPARVRVDTVRIMVPAPKPPPVPIVLRDTLVLEGINFDFDKADLLADDQEILDRVASALNDPEWVRARFEVAGHTSGLGTKEYNLVLSQQRADAVVAYLVSRGVASDRLTAKGYGEANPLYPNDNEGRNWRNRRVELRRRTQ